MDASSSHSFFFSGEFSFFDDSKPKNKNRNCHPTNVKSVRSKGDEKNILLAP